MIVASSQGSGSTTSTSAAVAATIRSHASPSLQADMGRSISGSPAGTPARTAFQPAASPSRRPTKINRTSACSSTYVTVSTLAVEYSGTLTWPAIQIATSAMIQWAVFLPKMPMDDFGGSLRACR
ncbi:hypothetical protein D9M71_301420 [compost metagenome]